MTSAEPVRFVCTDRGTHPERLLGVVSGDITERGFDPPPRRSPGRVPRPYHARAAVPPSAMWTRDGGGTRYELACPTCRRNWQRRNDRLEEDLAALRRAGIGRVDISLID